MARIRVNTPELINNLMMDHDVILGAIKVLYSIINNSNLNLGDVEELLRFFGGLCGWVPPC